MFKRLPVIKPPQYWQFSWLLFSNIVTYWIRHQAFFSETPDDIKHKLTAGGGFVASDGLEIVGMVLYQPHTEYMYLGRLAVLPDYRGRHIARNLIAAVEQEARKQNLYCVQLGVRLVLRDNQALFQRLGYTIKSYHAHEGYNDYTYATMEKRLPL
jgi:ribosomal protein S18 acetylase RimI-like enzyme